MGAIGIWEKDEGVLPFVKSRLRAAGLREPELIGASHPAELAAKPLELLIIAPGATGWAGAEALSCRMVLLPGSAGPLARAFQAESAVSYGVSPRDTITLSSLEGSQLCVAIQRELVTVSGGVVDRQEIILSLPEGWRSLPYLAAVGSLLLLGVPPEELN